MSDGLQTGNLYGKVKYPIGGVLPGVKITLSGKGEPQVQVTDAQGEFRYFGLTPGLYSIEAVLEYYDPLIYPDIVINVGRDTAIELTLISDEDRIIICYG
jgi:hypothetical protein